MTLCIVWRDGQAIKFASDSRLTFDSVVSDFGIKIARLPFAVFEAGETSAPAYWGELGMAIAGSAVSAVMIKETISEVIARLQGIPEYHELNMDGLAEIMFRAYDSITGTIGEAITTGNMTCMVFAGWCPKTERYRAFRMETNQSNQRRMTEVLTTTNIEIFGSGASAARALLPGNPGEREIIKALQSVIEDKAVKGVGGSVQYGSFDGSRFNLAGVAVLDEEGDVRYWRGPLDINEVIFSQDGLISNFEMLDFVTDK